MELTVGHETVNGEVIASFTLTELDEVMTVRELLQAFIYQKVTDSNQPVLPVTLTEYETRLNHKPTRDDKPVRNREKDWRHEADIAFEAFQKNTIFVIVDQVQLKDLDQKVKVATDSDIKFVRMIPLAGG